jgi:hypothetical protein
MRSVPEAAGKKIRFSAVVKNSGRPTQVTLWTDPAKDPGFKKAIRPPSQKK